MPKVQTMSSINSHFSIFSLLFPQITEF